MASVAGDIDCARVLVVYFGNLSGRIGRSADAADEIIDKTALCTENARSYSAILTIEINEIGRI